jgi:HSP20 family protein
MIQRLDSPRHTFYFQDAGDYCSGGWEPNTDIVETETEVLIRVELAGVAKEDVSVKTKGGKLIISGNRKPQTSTSKLYFHQIEINCGDFIKIISLPPALEHNEISAGFQEGMLEVHISKEDKAVEIPIAISTNALED